MNKLIQHLYTYLNFNDRSSPTSAEQRHAINTIFLLCGLYSLVAILFLIVFGFQAFAVGDVAYGKILTGSALLTLISYLAIWKSGRYKLASYQAVLFMGMLSLYLFYTGGVSSTGPIWVFIFPILSLFVLGYSLGFAPICLLFLLFVLIYVLEPGSFNRDMYEQVFLERLAAVYITVSAISYLFAYFRDMAEKKLKDINLHLEKTSNIDKLSGVLTVKKINHVLEEEVIKHSRYGNVFSVVLVDIDNISMLKERLGKDFAAYVIVELANILRSTLRQVDVAGRWRGEEFLLVLNGTNNQGAQVLASRIRELIENYTFKNDKESILLTASFAAHEYKGGRLEKFVRKTDELLSEAQVSGKSALAFQADGIIKIA